MEQEVVISRNKNIDAAVEELCSKLRNSLSSYQAVFFMAAVSYDFYALSEKIKDKFDGAEVIGASTAGEITKEGFTEDTIVLSTMRDPGTKVKGVFIDYGSKYPMVYKDEIESALKSCGIQCGDKNSHKDAFALAFINAVYNAEETILSNFYSIIKNDDFMLAGGTAGYTGNTAKTYVSYNGKVTQDGAVMLFVKTRCKFDIRQEDIFNPTGKMLVVSSSDTMKREISNMNGRNAVAAYADALGVSEAEAARLTFENPFGRRMKGSLYIAALAGFTPDKKINLFARVTPNSTLELMHVGDVIAKAEETCSGIRSEISHPKFTFMFSCVTRYGYYSRLGLCNDIISKYDRTFPTFCGFSCYGEQIGRMHCNQTLVTLVIGD